MNVDEATENFGTLGAKSEKHKGFEDAWVILDRGFPKWHRKFKDGFTLIVTTAFHDPPRWKWYIMLPFLPCLLTCFFSTTKKCSIFIWVVVSNMFLSSPLFGEGEESPFWLIFFTGVETTNYCSYFLHSGKLWRATLYVLGRVGFQANQVLFLDFCVFSFVCSTVFPSLSLSLVHCFFLSTT